MNIYEYEFWFRYGLDQQDCDSAKIESETEEESLVELQKLHKWIFGIKLISINGVKVEDMIELKSYILGKNDKQYPIAEPKPQNGLKRDIIELVLNLAEPDDDCMLSDFIHALQFVLDKHSVQFKNTISKTSSELIFIAKIKPDGSGTKMVSKRELKFLNENPTVSKSSFNMNILSIEDKTYIASGFDSYVVKLK